MIMNIIEFTPALSLDNAQMDDTHREFAALLNRIGSAPESELVAALDEFITHTEAHFAQERQWMEERPFPLAHCHVREHDGVLEITREVRKRVAAGETHLAAVLAKAVAEWFTNHVASMDMVLALFLKHGESIFVANGATNAAGACAHEGGTGACAPGGNAGACGHDEHTAACAHGATTTVAQT
jgi:hemerythrin-like metal-binding protein